MKVSQKRICFAFVAVIATALVMFCAMSLNNTCLVPAQAKTASYKIIYKLYGGSLKKTAKTSIKAKKKIKVSKLKKPTRKGYTFLGWYKDRAYTKKAKFIRGVRNKKQRTLYAAWQTKSYQIIYNTNGGSLSTTESSEEDFYVYTTAKGLRSLPTPTRSGYSFIGWYSDEALTTYVPEIEKGTTDEQVLYARWQLQTFISHRGDYSASDVGENTVEAFEASAAAGFDIVETDIQFTSDNVPMLLHDDSIDVLTQTSDGDEIWIEVPLEKLSYKQTQILTTKLLDSDDDEIIDGGLDTYAEGALACKELGLNMQVELKSGTEDQIATLVDIATKLDVLDITSWSSFKLALITYAFNENQDVPLVYISTTITEKKIKNAIKLQNKGSDVRLATKNTNLSSEMLARVEASQLLLGIYGITKASQAAEYDQYISFFTLDEIDTASTDETSSNESEETTDTDDTSSQDDTDDSTDTGSSGSE